MSLLNAELFCDGFAKAICTNRAKKVQNIVKYIEAKETLHQIEEQLNITKLREHDVIFLRDLVFQYMDCIDDERREKLEIKIYRMVYK